MGQRRLPLILDGSGNCEGGDSRIGADRACCRISNKACSRNGDSSYNGYKCSFSFIISLIRGWCKRSTVECGCQVGQTRIKRVSHNDACCCVGSGITGVLDTEGVG